MSPQGGGGEVQNFPRARSIPTSKHGGERRKFEIAIALKHLSSAMP